MGDATRDHGIGTIPQQGYVRASVLIDDECDESAGIEVGEGHRRASRSAVIPEETLPLRSGWSMAARRRASGLGGSAEPTFGGELIEKGGAVDPAEPGHRTATICDHDLVARLCAVEPVLEFTTKLRDSDLSHPKPIKTRAARQVPR